MYSLKTLLPCTTKVTCEQFPRKNVNPEGGPWSLNSLNIYGFDKFFKYLAEMTVFTKTFLFFFKVDFEVAKVVMPKNVLFHELPC